MKHTIYLIVTCVLNISNNSPAPNKKKYNNQSIYKNHHIAFPQEILNKLNYDSSSPNNQKYNRNSTNYP